MALLLLPGARADAIEGSLLSASVDFTGDLQAEFTPLAAFWRDARAIDSATLVASELKVVRWDTRETTKPVLLKLEDRSAEYVVHDATVQIQGTEGWMGLYGQPGATWSAEESGGWTLEARDASSIGNTPTKPGDGVPRSDAPMFEVDVDFPHVFGSLGGLLSIRGPILLKATGPTIRIASTENTTENRTGYAADSPLTMTTTWMLLEAKDARVEIASRGPADIAAPRLIGHLDGAMSTPDALLDARAGSRTLSGDGAPAWLQGSFAFDAGPQSGARGLRLAFSGETSGASVQTVAVPAWRRDEAPWLAGAGSVALLGAAVAVSRLRKKPAPLSVEQCVQLASAAAEEGDMQTALDWTRRAQRLAPTSARLRTDEGYYLQELGDYDGALVTLGMAAQMSSDGEAPYLAAVLLATRLGDPARAEEHLALALRQSPVLVLEAEDDDRVAPLLSRPLARSAALGAHRELDKDESLAS